jgi:hypothetical protein
MSKLVSSLYRLARFTNDLDKIASGDPIRIARRFKNKVIGIKIISKVWKFPF